MQKIKGQNITQAVVFNSQYSQTSIDVKDDQDNWYKLPMSTILQMVSEFNFKTEKKRKHTHLTDAELIEDNLDN